MAAKYASEDDEAHERETLAITDEDAAWILGKQGRTKQKIAKISGCNIELREEAKELEFRGTATERRRALVYTKCVLQQRTGPVTLNPEDVEDDCTVVHVPVESVGFVTGKSGCFLRTVEDEHGVLMCFASCDSVEKGEEEETLMIFGPYRSRRGAQLTIMSVVESKVPGHFTQPWLDSKETFEIPDGPSGFGTTAVELNTDEISLAVGRKGHTRRKIASASGCLVQCIGKVVFMSGLEIERSHAEDYLQWMLECADTPNIPNVQERDDCTVVEVPMDCVGYIMGPRREALSGTEEQTGTLMFFLGPDQDNSELERLAIFGSDRQRKGAELIVMSSVERKVPGQFTQGVSERTSSSKGLDTDRIMLGDDVSYVLGREGSTRKKLERASHAILQLMGQLAYIAGDLSERKRCRDYITWLLWQKDNRDGSGMDIDPRGRSDVTAVELDEGWSAQDLGVRGGADIRSIEQETGTFILVSTDKTGHEEVLIFGHEEGAQYSETGRLKAKRLLLGIMRSKQKQHQVAAREQQHDRYSRDNQPNRDVKDRWEGREQSQQTSHRDRWNERGSWSSSDRWDKEKSYSQGYGDRNSNSSWSSWKSQNERSDWNESRNRDSWSKQRDNGRETREPYHQQDSYHQRDAHQASSSSWGFQRERSRSRDWPRRGGGGAKTTERSIGAAKYEEPWATRPGAKRDRADDADARKARRYSEPSWAGGGRNGSIGAPSSSDPVPPWRR